MAAVTKRKKPVNIKRALFIVGGLAIPFINWFVFYVYPNIASILMAFTDSHGAVSADNFIRFFNEFQQPTSQIRLAFKNTFITFGILFVTFPLKVLVSYFIYKKVPFAGFYRVVFFLPSIIFSVAIAMVFIQIVGPEGAIAQTIQKWMGLDYTPELLADSRFANYTVLGHLIWINFPGDLVIWGGTFARIPEDVLESARVDGVTWWTEFTKIIVPMVWPTVALQMILLCCGIFSASGAVFLLTEGYYDTMTIGAWLYLTLYRNSGSMYTSNVYNYMSAIGISLTVVAVTISLFVRRFTDRAFEEVEY